MLVAVVNPAGKLPPEAQVAPLALTAVDNDAPVDIATNVPGVELAFAPAPHAIAIYVPLPNVGNVLEVQLIPVVLDTALFVPPTATYVPDETPYASATNTDDENAVLAVHAASIAPDVGR
jgi:hypothetical protein